ncbi:MAG: hypothetical protein JWQ36_181 [Enterovirga sp.]|jgi:hypothetical protein|nr:hypothetical protein [Enterovirga sp.]
MSVAAAALVAHTVPVAGLYLAAEQRAELRELFILAYVGATGAIVSATAYLGGFFALPVTGF